LIKAGSDYVWLWVAIEPRDKMILGIRISIERSMLVAEQFIQSLIRKYGKHNISTDGGTWYPQACRILNMEHHIHSSLEKSFIERTIQYIKDRTDLINEQGPFVRYKIISSRSRRDFDFISLLRSFSAALHFSIISEGEYQVAANPIC